MWWLAIHHDIAISRSSLQQNLEEAGLTRKLLHKIARERDAKVRADYFAVIRDHAAGDGEEFVFVDEMSKNDHVTGAAIWSISHWGNGPTSLTILCEARDIQWWPLSQLTVTLQPGLF